MNLLMFESKRFLKKRYLLFSILSMLFILLINIMLEIATSETNFSTTRRFVNLFSAISQFSMLAFIPMVSSAFSSDYEKHNIFFYLQNKIDFRKCSAIKIMVYDGYILIVFFITMILAMLIYRVGFLDQIGKIIFLSACTVLYGVNMILLFSLIFKKKTTCMMFSIFWWLSMHIIGAINFKYIGGFLSPMDGMSFVSKYVSSLIGTKVHYYNTIPIFSEFQTAAITSLFWVILPIVLSIIISNKVVVKNAI